MALAADFWTALGTIAALAAATAAALGLLFAKRTVDKADETLRESRQAHGEEMAERRDALEKEIKLRRIDQIQHALDTLIDMRQAAFNVNQTRDQSNYQAVLVVLGAKLGAALTALIALGGPTLPDLETLATEAENRTRPPVQIEGEAYQHIVRIRDLLRTDESLRIS